MEMEKRGGPEAGERDFGGLQPGQQVLHPGYPPADGQPGYPPGYAPPGGFAQPGYGPPIVQQPIGNNIQGGWMNMPHGDSGVPPGLEYLTQVDQLLVQQKIELLEVLIGFETKNKYAIKNSLGQDVYFAAEESDCCSRQCCGPMRPMEIKILDNYKQEVIHLNRPLACSSCCYPCCLQTMEVSSPPGTVIGTVEQEWSILTPKFQVKNAAGDTVMKIRGPICVCSCFGDVDFKVLSADGTTEVGKISKQWSGLVRELFTDADNFGISFPLELDVKMKAVMLGACFLIDMMYFEKSAND